MHDALGTPYCKLHGTSHHISPDTAWCKPTTGSGLHAAHSFVEAVCLSGICLYAYVGLPKTCTGLTCKTRFGRAQICTTRESLCPGWTRVVAARWCCARVCCWLRSALVLVHTGRVRPWTAEVALQLGGVVVGRRAFLHVHGLQADRWPPLGKCCWGREADCVKSREQKTRCWMVDVLHKWYHNHLPSYALAFVLQASPEADIQRVSRAAFAATPTAEVPNGTPRACRTPTKE